MKPDDIGRIVTVSSPAVSPDGGLVAYVVTRVDLPGNRYRSAVWVTPTDGSGQPWQLTAGEERDSQPVWSPDGRRLAFTTRHEDAGGARVPGKEHSLRVLPVVTGGETVTLLTRPEPVSGLAWAPDGTRLTFASRVRAPRYEPAEEAARPPRRVDRLFPRLDSVGWTIDRPTQVFVLPADGSGPPLQVTEGPHEHGPPAWSPDGHRLAFTAARHEDADLDLVNDVWVVDLTALPADGDLPELVRVTRTDASYELVSWSPGGADIAVLRTPTGTGYHHAQVAVVSVAAGELRVGTAGLDRNCAPYPGARPPVWQDSDLLFAVEDRGCVHLYRTQGKAAPEALVTGSRSVTGYDAQAGVLAFTATAATQPSELFLRLADGTERQLTRHQDAFLAACPPAAPERFTVRSEDGLDIDAWALRPTAPAGDSARLPMLLTVHGGPHTQYGERWHDEFQLYAAAGFVVLYANPHGSTGYDEASARSIISPKSAEDPGTGWGGVDYRDLMAVVDAALERCPEVDQARLGVMGGSYGGYMTSWVIGHTRRFAAACSERAVNNLLSLEWSSDVAGYFRFEMGVSHLDEPDEYLRMSPITYVRDIQTPVLILHSEEDARCHVEQADCLWVALRLLRKEVAYYRFPAESHELSRSGSPAHRVQRADLILDWFRSRLAGSDVTGSTG